MKEIWLKTKEFFKKNPASIFTILLILILTGTLISTSMKDGEKIKEVTYLEFEEMVKKEKVKEVTFSPTGGSFTFVDQKKKEYSSSNPRTATFKEDLLKEGIKVTEKSTEPKFSDYVVSLLFSVLQFAIIIGLIIFLFKHIQNSNGKSKEMTNVVEKPTHTFKDIAGNEEAKEEMLFLVDFLKNPELYKDAGAKLPKGVFLYGPPGTGKTLTAKAIAGEAGVSFFSLSGSDFIEKYVGVGASRVRDVFKAARKHAPSIIFIDEIDSVGGNRDDGNSESRQTLNALLSEMDGFEGSEGIIVIGATNRLDDLDPAFVRPGRFDKQIAINLPEQKDRLEILKLHAKNKRFSPLVNWENLSKTTIGLSGAAIATLLNEAAIIATTNKHVEITTEDIDDAFFKMVMKGQKKKNQAERNMDELTLVAWHEAGHALASKMLTGNEVPKVTIISSTSGAGGVTFMLPKKSGLLSKKELRDDIRVLYAGRAAEQILLGEYDLVTTGASQDISQATNKIRAMLLNYGMSERYGMLNPSQLSGNTKSYEDPLFLEEASKLSRDLYNDTYLFLMENKYVLQSIAEALLDKETLTDDDLNRLIKNDKVLVEI